jgi:thioredoxin 1
MIDLSNTKGFVLVDFWGPWCAPCKALNPVLDELAKKYQGKLDIVKINVQEDTETPQRYLITSLPTVLLLVDGTVSAVVCAPTRQKLSELIEKKILKHSTDRESALPEHARHSGRRGDR